MNISRQIQRQTPKINKINHIHKCNDRSAAQTKLMGLMSLTMLDFSQVQEWHVNLSEILALPTPMLNGGFLMTARKDDVHKMLRH